MPNSVPSKGLEWLNLLLGVGLYCAAFWFGKQPAAAMSAGISGLLIAICSAIALNRYKPWTEWLNLGFGSWSIIAPFILGFGPAQFPRSINLAVGLCVSTIATWQLIASREAVFAHSKAPKWK